MHYDRLGMKKRRAPPLLPLARAVYLRHQAEFAQGNSAFNHEHPCLDLGRPRMNFVPYPWKRIPGEWRENVCLERVMAGKPAIDPEH